MTIPLKNNNFISNNPKNLFSEHLMTFGKKKNSAKQSQCGGVVNIRWHTAVTFVSKSSKDCHNNLTINIYKEHSTEVLSSYGVLS